jgi:hypothetical protein
MINQNIQEHNGLHRLAHVNGGDNKGEETANFALLALGCYNNRN